MKKLLIVIYFFTVCFTANELAAMSTATEVLGYAVTANKPYLAKKAIEGGADVNAHCSIEHTIFKDVLPTFLFSAMERKKFPIFKMLVLNKADVNVELKNGLTPLLYSIFLENMDKFTYLVEAGADLNKKSAGGTTPLLYAAALGYFDMVKILITHGAHINTRGNIVGETVLHWAAISNDFDFVKFLVSFGADVNVRDMHGAQPSYWTKNADIKAYLALTAHLSAHYAKDANETYADKFFSEKYKKKNGCKFYANLSPKIYPKTTIKTKMQKTGLPKTKLSQTILSQGKQYRHGKKYLSQRLMGYSCC